MHANGFASCRGLRNAAPGFGKGEFGMACEFGAAACKFGAAACGFAVAARGFAVAARGFAMAARGLRMAARGLGMAARGLGMAAARQGGRAEWVGPAAGASERLADVEVGPGRVRTHRKIPAQHHLLGFEEQKAKARAGGQMHGTHVEPA